MRQHSHRGEQLAQRHVEERRIREDHVELLGDKCQTPDVPPLKLEQAAEPLVPIEDHRTVPTPLQFNAHLGRAQDAHAPKRLKHVRDGIDRVVVEGVLLLVVPLLHELLIHVL